MTKIKEALSVLMLCAPVFTAAATTRMIHKWWTSSIYMFCLFSREKKNRHKLWKVY